MDPSAGARQPRKGRSRVPRNQAPPQNPQLFDDTSTQPPGYGPPPGYDPTQAYGYTQGGYTQGMNAGQFDAEQMPEYDYSQGVPPVAGGFDQSPGYGPPQTQYAGQQLLADPMANMAVQYGHTLADQGKDYVHKNIEKYVSTSKLKYYFAVDTSYVGRKLGLLLFPFIHQDWSIKYSQDEEPVAPRYEINAPDLYIPVMAFVTYILLAGLTLGTQNRFTPEQLGITSSTAMVWTIIEILALLFTLYVMNVTTDLKYLDLLAYCGYKYVGMILSLLAGLLFQSVGYYVVLLWTSFSIAFFLIRSLKVAIIPHSDQDFMRGNKRRLYVLLMIALTQPVLMWWLTWHLVGATPAK